MNSAVPLRYLALGDSYTIGEAVPAHECWPAQLARGLRQQGLGIDDPQIVARTGWTTSELSKAMDAATLTANCDLVTLQIGVNNQYRGESVDAYQTQFAALLTRAIALADGRMQRVLVVSIPDWGVTRFAREQGRDPADIAAALNAFNGIARKLASRTGTNFVDITPISRHHPELVAEDGLHPSAAQYALWVQVILPVVCTALR